MDMHLKEGLEKMGDEIKGAFVRDNALHFVKGSQIMQVTDNGKEPNEWPVVHFAIVGTSDEFVEVLSGALLELVDAGHIFGVERGAVIYCILSNSSW